MTHAKLIRLREQSKALTQLREQITRLEAYRLSPGVAAYGSEHVKSSTRGDGMLDALIRMDELVFMYRQEANAALALQADFERALASLSPLEKRIMRYYYLDALTWTEVAAQVGYSTRHVMRIAKRAEQKFDQIDTCG